MRWMNSLPLAAGTMRSDDTPCQAASCAASRV
jgi:hypothetical protein